MFNRIMLVLLLICAAGAWHHYNSPQPTPQQVIQPITIEQLQQPIVPPNQQTAPVEEAQPVTPVQPKKDKAPIRYDKNVERPGGYYDYCDKYPNKPECGGR